jgi:hypothetical protein
METFEFLRCSLREAKKLPSPPPLLWLPAEA